MRKYVVAAMVGLFLGTVCGIASARESKDSQGSQPSGECRKVRDISYTRDGSMVIRSAWRCEKAQPNKPKYGKVKSELIFRDS